MTTLFDAIKIITITNMGDSEISHEIKSDIPHDNNWLHLGDDYYQSPGGGIAGPSIGDPTRTLVAVENFPCCPVCNAWIRTGDLYGCQCQPSDIEDFYGI